jgi:hypothetical protein
MKFSLETWTNTNIEKDPEAQLTGGAHINPMSLLVIEAHICAMSLLVMDIGVMSLLVMEAHISAMSLIVMEAHIGAMSQIVILVIWFGYIARHSQWGRGPFTCPWWLLPVFAVARGLVGGRQQPMLITVQMTTTPEVPTAQADTSAIKVIDSYIQ